MSACNPNNCTTCEYKEQRGPGDSADQHCYMFLESPTEVCMQHTARNENYDLLQRGLYRMRFMTTQ